jgi:hypothetical protein
MRKDGAAKRNLIILGATIIAMGIITMLIVKYIV